MGRENENKFKILTLLRGLVRSDVGRQGTVRRYRNVSPGLPWLCQLGGKKDQKRTKKFLVLSRDNC